MTGPSRILIVAEDDALRALMHDALSDRFDTAVAEDVLACTDLLLAGHYDLLILDDNLPVMTGREYIHVLEAQEAFQSLPVLIVSADGALEKKIQSNGNRGFLAKPFALDELDGQVQHLLQAHPSGPWAGNASNVQGEE